MNLYDIEYQGRCLYIGIQQKDSVYEWPESNYGFLNRKEIDEDSDYKITPHDCYRHNDKCWCGIARTRRAGRGIGQ